MLCYIAIDNHNSDIELGWISDLKDFFQEIFLQ